MDTLGNEDTMPTPLKADQIDALFAGWDAPGAPGGTLAVLRGGAVVHQRCFGLASLEQLPLLTGGGADGQTLASALAEHVVKPTT